MTNALAVTPIDRAVDYAERLSGWYDRRMESEIWHGSAGWNSPSVIGHPCERFLVLRRTKGDLQKPTTIETQKVMERGKEIHRIALLTLATAGFQIIRIESQIEYRALMLRGKADDVARPGGAVGPYHIFDVKSMPSNTFNRLHDLDDIRNHPRSYIRGIPHQLVAYLMLERHKRSREAIDKDVATIWLWNVDNWQWRFIPIPYDGELVEEITTKCETVNAHIAARTEPPPINDPDICPGCSFFMTEACNPQMALAPDISVVTDEGVVNDVKRCLELKPLASEFEALRKRLNAKFTDVTQALVPDVALVSGKWVERNMPAQAARTDRFWKSSYLPLTEEKGEE